MLEAIKIVRLVSVLEYMNLIAHDRINNIKDGAVTVTLVANNIRCNQCITRPFGFLLCTRGWFQAASVLLRR